LKLANIEGGEEGEKEEEREKGEDRIETNQKQKTKGHFSIFFCNIY